MTKPELLLDVIGEAQDDYLEELDAHIVKVKRRRKQRKVLLVAACLCLVVCTVVFGLYHFPFGISGSSNYTSEGIAAGGYFYYEVPGDGFFRYTPEDGSVCLMKGSLFDRWFNRWYSFTANDYGFYYTKDDWIYRVRHGETASEKLYHYEAKVSTPYMYPAGENDIAVEVHYDSQNAGLHNELFIVDGITSERKTTIIDNNVMQEEIDALPDVMSSEYDDASYKLLSQPSDFAEKVTYTVGERTLELVLEKGNDWDDYTYRLTENGKQLYNGYVEPYDVRTAGDSLVFTVGRDGSSIGKDLNGYVIVDPDGTNHVVNVPSVPGDERFFYTRKDNDDEQSIIAVRVSDNEKTKLKWDVSEDNIAWEIESDGEYIWATGYDRISCYRIEYQNNIPISLTLIDDDITDN